MTDTLILGGGAGGGSMNKKPIIFSGEMVRAILEGRKTQTRRVIKPQPIDGGAIEWFARELLHLDSTTLWKYIDCNGDVIGTAKCPYGPVGGRLWVRETHFIASTGKIFYRADVAPNWPWPTWSWRPSIFMPRWASRITLQLTNVRVERVQDISHADALAEGTDDTDAGGNLLAGSYAVTNFARLWDTINAKRGYSWDVNPWVWVLEFERVDA